MRCSSIALLLRVAAISNYLFVPVNQQLMCLVPKPISGAGNET